MSTDHADAADYDENGDLVADRGFDLTRYVRTGDYLDNVEFPPLAWAVHGLIPEGFGLLTGAPKAGKSWASLDLALAVAAGTPALGKVATGHGRPVLLLALEDGERRLKGRCRHLLGEGAPIPSGLHYVTACTPADVVPLIEAWLDQHGETNPLVVLDTLGKVMPNANPGEGAYQRDYRIGSTLKRLVDEHPGSTLLVVHHVRKASGEDWMDSTSGTNGLNGAADFTLNLSRKRNEEAGIIRVTGRDVPENEYAVTCHEGRWTIDGTELADAAAKAQTLRETADLGDRSTEIVEYITAASQPVSAGEVADALALPDARRYLSRLVDSGRLTRPSRGKYTTVPSVPSVPSEWCTDDNGTHGTHGTPTGQTPKCSICRFPLDDLSVQEGASTHAGCVA